MGKFAMPRHVGMMVSQRLTRDRVQAAGSPELVAAFLKRFLIEQIKITGHAAKVT